MKKTQFKTYDNFTAPIKDNIKKTSFKMTFSKSNFMFIGKWIIAFVLIIVFGSQALNGFISSKFTKNSTTEIIVHEYKKQIGTELVGGNFDDFTYDNFGELTFNKKIYFKKIVPSIDFVSITQTSSSGGNGWFGLTFTAGNFRLYDSNDNLLFYSRYNTPIYIKYSYYINSYSRNFDYLYYTIYNNSGFQASVFICDIIGNNVSNSSSTSIQYPTASYFTYENYYNSNSYIKDYNSNDGRLSFNDNYFTTILNDSFIYDSYTEIPIYETTTYTYEVRDNNYNWDTKLKQLSAFKPLFKFNQSFINDEYVKYSNLISYEYTYTESSIGEVVNRYKSDERLKPLFDNNYITIGGKTESGLFKDKTRYYSFIKFNFPLDYDIQGVSSAYNWVIDNYVTDFNIDSYLNESKYKVELKDILEIFKFPIQIVNNLVYDFGVLIGFITWW